MKRLWTTFRYTYRGLRGQILAWGLGLAGFGLLIVSMFDIMGEQRDTLEQMISSYPPEFLAFFGGDVNSLLTPAGFLKMYAFSMLPIIVGIFAVLAGSGLLASDEERGRLDLIMAHPVGRSSFFFGRFLGLFGAILTIMFLGWMGFCFLLGNSSLGIFWGQMVPPLLSLFVQTLLYSSLALLLSMLLPTRSLAAMLAGAVMVISYFLSSLSFMDATIETVAKTMPYYYYQVVLSFEELNFTWLLVLLGISALMAGVAWFRFSHRDIRLSGEGSWKQLFLLKRRQTA